MHERKLLITGGPILTMDKEMCQEAVAVRGEKIEFVGSLEDIKNKVDDTYEEIDLKGQTLIPGFIDPHVHVMMLGMCNTWADLTYPNVKNIDELVEELIKYGEKLPEGAPIRGFGFDKRQLEEKRYPNSKDLNRVSENRSVQIMNGSGHCNIVNDYLMGKIGVSSETKDPEGGSLGRDSEGNPNGILFDSANDYLAEEEGVKPGKHGPNIHMPDTEKNLLQNIEIGQKLLIEAGFTSVNDVQVTKQEMESYLTARDKGLLKLRINLSFLSQYLEEFKNLGINSTISDDKLTMGSIKLYADGSLISGTAYMNYDDDERAQGYLFHEKEDFKKLLIAAHNQGLQTLTHAQGDGAIELVIQAVEQAQEENPKKDMRHRIEHCGLPTKEQIKRMKEYSILPVPQPQLVYLYGDGIRNAVGELGEHFSPYGWFKEQGLPLILSSDTPVAFPNAFEAIYAAVTRKTIDGNVLGEEHKISLEEAIKGYTINAAKSMHKEETLGSISEGKLADFSVLNKNPFEIDLEDLMDVQVNETWISGEKIYSKS